MARERLEKERADRGFDDGNGLGVILNSLIIFYYPWLNMASYISMLCSMYGQLHHLLCRNLLWANLVFFVILGSVAFFVVKEFRYGFS